MVMAATSKSSKKVRLQRRKRAHLPTTSNLRLKAPPRHISQPSSMSLQQESPNAKAYETPGRKYPRVSYQDQTVFRLTSNNQR